MLDARLGARETQTQFSQFEAVISIEVTVSREEASLLLLPDSTRGRVRPHSESDVRSPTHKERVSPPLAMAVKEWQVSGGEEGGTEEPAAFVVAIELFGGTARGQSN